MQELAAETEFSVDRVVNILKVEIPEPVSLDQEVNDSIIRKDVITDPKAPPPYIRIFHTAIRREIDLAMGHLTNREQEVLRLRLGLLEDADGPMTLEQIGNALHLSRERARQIEAGALQKLRRSEVGGRLRETITAGESFFQHFAGYSISETRISTLSRARANQGEPAASVEPAASDGVDEVLDFPPADGVRTSGVLCARCNRPVTVRPTLGGHYYRCGFCRLVERV